MGRKAENVVAATTEAIRKRIRDGSGQPQKEWRVAGHPGLVLMTKPSGVGTFYLFYRSEFGKARKLRLGEFGPLTLADAFRLALDKRAEVENGVDPVAEQVAQRKAITFEALAERFLAESPTLSASTRKVYTYSLAKDAYPVIGSKPAAAVSADDVLAICKRIEATGLSVQPERTKAIISGVYRWAMRERLVSDNPCKGIGRRSHKVARTRTPTDAEIATLWKAMDGAAKLSPGMRLIIRLAVLTGQRRTEVAGARVDELVDLDTNTPKWIIPGDVNKRGKIIEGRTKNGREQIVPLSTQAVVLFREALETCANADYVFPANTSTVKVGKAPRTPHVNGESVTMAMRRLRETAGVDDVSIHDMRRAVSNWMKDQGISREVRDLVLNHKDPSVTEAHYSQSARMLKQVGHALQAWADHVEAVVSEGERKGNVVKLSGAVA